MLGSPSSACFLLVIHPAHFLCFLCIFQSFLSTLIRNSCHLVKALPSKAPQDCVVEGWGGQGSVLILTIGWWALVCLSFPGHVSCTLSRVWNRVGEPPVRFLEETGMGKAGTLLSGVSGSPCQ